MNKERNALNVYLEQLPAGRVESISELEYLLAASWHSLAGSDAGGMEAHKLHGRIEHAHWEPPILSFRIERHGSIVCGSTRAEIQSWEVNTLAWTAEMGLSGHRQLKPMSPRLDVKPLAAEVRDLIINHQEDARLKWVGEQRVRLQVGKIIPAEGFKQTLAGRRKRFRATFDELLSAAGWRRVGPNDYERTP